MSVWSFPLCAAHSVTCQNKQHLLSVISASRGCVTVRKFMGSFSSRVLLCCVCVCAVGVAASLRQSAISWFHSSSPAAAHLLTYKASPHFPLFVRSLSMFSCVTSFPLAVLFVFSFLCRGSLSSSSPGLSFYFTSHHGHHRWPSNPCVTSSSPSRTILSTPQ